MNAHKIPTCTQRSRKGSPTARTNGSYLFEGQRVGRFQFLFEVFEQLSLGPGVKEQEGRAIVADEVALEAQLWCAHEQAEGENVNEENPQPQRRTKRRS